MAAARLVEEEVFRTVNMRRKKAAGGEDAVHESVHDSDQAHQSLETRFPLHAAAVVGDVVRVRSLLGVGEEGRKGMVLKADEEDDQGRTALHYAVTTGQIAVCEALLDRMPEIMSVKAMGLFGSTALHVAVSHKQREAVNLLLRREADISLKNHSGQTPLHLAAGAGDLHIVRALLRKGADIESRANDGRTALLAAVQNGHRAVAGLLINHGAGMGVQTAFKENALHLAASVPTTHPDTVQWLLSAGTDVNAQRADDKRPLQVACEMIIDDALRDLVAQEPYWQIEEVFAERLGLSDPSISVRDPEDAHKSFSVAEIDLDAIKKKFGISESDLRIARRAMGKE